MECSENVYKMLIIRLFWRPYFRLWNASCCELAAKAKDKNKPLTTPLNF